jgi:NlpC/P60 family putative phage cell wall peptidase
MMIEVSVTEAGPGAMVVFRMMPRAIAKHVGILTAPGSFIHAYERLGVIEQPLTQSWRRRIAFAFLFPEGD